jgi:hypothetical protein
MAFSLDYVKQYYKMPFVQRGMVVEASGKRGKITAGDGGYIRVRYEGERTSIRRHPQWEMVYFDESGNIIKDYRKA